MSVVENTAETLAVVVADTNLNDSYRGYHTVDCIAVVTVVVVVVVVEIVAVDSWLQNLVMASSCRG